MCHLRNFSCSTLLFCFWERHCINNVCSFSIFLVYFLDIFLYILHTKVLQVHIVALPITAAVSFASPPSLPFVILQQVGMNTWNFPLTVMLNDFWAFFDFKYWRTQRICGFSFIYRQLMMRITIKMIQSWHQIQQKGPF